MKRLIISGTLTALLLSVSLITVESLAFGAKDSAQGQGILVNEDNSQSEFAFNAKRNPNGKVTGSATLRNPSYRAGKGEAEKIKIDVTCLKIVGNVAILGGVTKRKNSQAKAEAVYFAVQDNGDQDSIFRGFYFDDDPATDSDPQVCQLIETNVPMFEPIVSGEIQVIGQ